MRYRRVRSFVGFFGVQIVNSGGGRARAPYDPHGIYTTYILHYIPDDRLASYTIICIFIIIRNIYIILLYVIHLYGGDDETIPTLFRVRCKHAQRRYIPFGGFGVVIYIMYIIIILLRGSAVQDVCEPTTVGIHIIVTRLLL